MPNDDDIVLVSAVEHYSYCPRQCMLIHVEQVFDENVFTLRGSQAHERVDVPDVGTEEGVRVERAMPIWSERMGLQGRADVVEFPPGGAPVPVEYKSGPRRQHAHDDLQLCAQAMCLEEMLEVAVPRGAVFHIATKRRRLVEFTAEMRREVERAVVEIRGLMRAGVTPPPANDARCPNCSLINACVPDVLARARLARLADELYRTEE